MRRFFFFAFLLLVPATLAYALAAEAPPKAETKPAAATAAFTLPERVIGDKAAKVTLIEYASLTCSHCGDFATKLLPQLEEKYIKTGKVKLVFRDFPLDATALQAAQIAQCMPEDRYFPFLKTLFRSQAGWLTAPDPKATLWQYAKLAGMSEERIKACLADKNIENAIVKESLEATKKYAVRSTPTFIVSTSDARTETIEGAHAIADFDKVLEKYLK